MESIRSGVTNFIRYVIVPTAAIMLIFVLLIVWVYNMDADDVDLLFIYTLISADGESSFVLYDPQNHARAALPAEVRLPGSRFSADGRITFLSLNANSTDIYVLQVLSAPASRIDVTQSPTVDEYPLAWSHDGRYLAFESHDADYSRRIYVWDGETTTDITPDGLLDHIAGFHSPSWSFDGRLVFAVSYSVYYEDDPGEIYLWDGNTTVNLSQNPAGYDGAPTWSADGRLAFLSRRNGEFGILIWDGVSANSHSPDVGTFTHLPTGQISIYSPPTWTNRGQIAFVGVGPQDSYRQIYVWDGAEVANVSQNPGLHNGVADWSSDGRWAFATIPSSQSWLYVRDADNQPLLKVENAYGAVWSSDGYLIFCRQDSSEYVLSMWDGQRITEIARGIQIWADWQSGDSVVCRSV